MDKFPRDPRLPKWGVTDDTSFFKRLVQRLEEWMSGIADHINADAVSARVALTTNQPFPANTDTQLTFSQIAHDANEIVRMGQNAFDLEPGMYWVSVAVFTSASNGKVVLKLANVTAACGRVFGGGSAVNVVLRIETRSLLTVDINCTSAGTTGDFCEISISNIGPLP